MSSHTKARFCELQCAQRLAREVANAALAQPGRPIPDVEEPLGRSDGVSSPSRRAVLVVRAALGCAIELCQEPLVELADSNSMEERHKVRVWTLLAARFYHDVHASFEVVVHVMPHGERQQVRRDNSKSGDRLARDGRARASPESDGSSESRSRGTGGGGRSLALDTGLDDLLAIHAPPLLVRNARWRRRVAGSDL